jgi:hypothetical protein
MGCFVTWSVTSTANVAPASSSPSGTPVWPERYLAGSVMKIYLGEGHQERERPCD